MLASVRNRTAAAPSDVPGFLKDDKQDDFFRTNVALAFAKAAANKKVYEEALDALKSVKPGVRGRSGQLLLLQGGLRARDHEEGRGDPLHRQAPRRRCRGSPPERYTMVATLMFFDMQNWSPDPKDLSNIERLMDNSGRRLDLARGGEKTQDIQKKIVFRLDELIKELENKAKPATGRQRRQLPRRRPEAGQWPSGRQHRQPDQDRRRQRDHGRQRHGQGGREGTPPDRRTVGDHAAGEAAPRSCKEITRDLPPKFEPMIKNYFEALDKIHGYKK